MQLSWLDQARIQVVANAWQLVLDSFDNRLLQQEARMKKRVIFNLGEE